MASLGFSKLVNQRPPVKKILMIAALSIAALARAEQPAPAVDPKVKPAERRPERKEDRADEQRERHPRERHDQDDAEKLKRRVKRSTVVRRRMRGASRSSGSHRRPRNLRAGK
jgi:hypothetical protein